MIKSINPREKAENCNLSGTLWAPSARCPPNRGMLWTEKEWGQGWSRWWDGFSQAWK